MSKSNKAVPLNLEFSAEVDALVQQRKIWEAGTYAASNAELYKVLADTLDLMLKIKTSVDLGKGLNALLRQREIAFNDSTSLAVKVVRLVFAEPKAEERSKHRLYGYARVLTVATENKITGATLAQFIEQRGGIDEIRRMSKDGQSKTDRDRILGEHAEATLAKPTAAAIVPSFSLPDLLQPAEDMQYSLALVRKDADGKGSVVFGTNNKTLVKQVLAIAGKNLHETEDNERLESKAQAVEDIRSGNVSKLKAEMGQHYGVAPVPMAEHADFA